MYSFGIAINAFLILLLSLKKSKTVSDRILIVWFFLGLIHQTLIYMNEAGTYFTRFPFLIGTNIPLPLIHGSFLYLYVSSLTDDAFKIKINHLLHFLPALILYIFLIKFFVLPAQQKLYIITHKGIGFELSVTIKFIAIILSGAIYVVLSFIKIQKHQKKIKAFFSNTEKINLQWLKLITLGIGAIWVVVLIGNESLTSLVISLFVSVTGIFGIRQLPIFSNPELVKASHPIQENQTGEKQLKYEKSILSDAKKEMLKNLLKQKIEVDKLFLDPDLTLDTLASSINIHPNYLSQYINEVLGYTFYDYVNMKRIEEFKRKIIQDENKNLNFLGIAFDCGFNSKSTFNRNFKRITGQTPSEYANSIKTNVDDAR